MMIGCVVDGRMNGWVDRQTVGLPFPISLLEDFTEQPLSYTPLLSTKHHLGS